MDTQTSNETNIVVTNGAQSESNDSQPEANGSQSEATGSQPEATGSLPEANGVDTEITNSVNGWNEGETTIMGDEMDTRDSGSTTTDTQASSGKAGEIVEGTAGEMEEESATSTPLVNHTREGTAQGTAGEPEESTTSTPLVDHTRNSTPIVDDSASNHLVTKSPIIKEKVVGKSDR